MFSEKSANYEAFCQMRKKINNLSIKITRQQKNLKTVSVHYKNTDLILKMIKKAKISRVRVPLKRMSWRGVYLMEEFHKGGCIRHHPDTQAQNDDGESLQAEALSRFPKACNQNMCMSSRTELHFLKNAEFSQMSNVGRVFS